MVWQLFYHRPAGAPTGLHGAGTGLLEVASCALAPARRSGLAALGQGLAVVAAGVVLRSLDRV